MKMSLSKQTNVKLPQFIIDCFKSFTLNKKQITLNMYSLHYHGNGNMNNLLFYSMVERNEETVFKQADDWNINKLLFHSLIGKDYDKEFKPNDDDLSNVVHSDLFAFFPNVTSLIINSGFGGVEFCFSLMALLNVIFETNLNEIIINSYGNVCWIKRVWNSDKEILKKEYTAKGFKIAMNNVESQCNLKINKL